MTGHVPEVEATLLVVPGPGRGAGETARRVASLRRLAGYRVRGGGSTELRDAYWDTPDRRLRARGLALRIRREQGTTTLALKGEERPLPGGGLERLEIEGAWSPAALEEVRDALARRGVELEGGQAAGRPGAARGSAAGGPGEGRPEEVLRGMGLRPVQRRVTVRRLRRIEPPDGGEPVGELAVDRVEYRTPDGRTLRHREVEVEAGGPGAEAAVAEVSSALLERFGGRLRRWDHGKLDTGEAIAALARRGAMGGPAVEARPGEGSGPDAALTPEDYARIEALLEEWKGETPG